MDRWEEPPLSLEAEACVSGLITCFTQEIFQIRRLMHVLTVGFLPDVDALLPVGFCLTMSPPDVGFCLMI